MATLVGVTQQTQETPIIAALSRMPWSFQSFQQPMPNVEASYGLQFFEDSELLMSRADIYIILVFNLWPDSWTCGERCN